LLHAMLAIFFLIQRSAVNTSLMHTQLKAICSNVFHNAKLSDSKLVLIAKLC